MNELIFKSLQDEYCLTCDFDYHFWYLFQAILRITKIFIIYLDICNYKPQSTKYDTIISNDFMRKNALKCSNLEKKAITTLFETEI